MPDNVLRIHIHHERGRHGADVHLAPLGNFEPRRLACKPSRRNTTRNHNGFQDFTYLQCRLAIGEKKVCDGDDPFFKGIIVCIVRPHLGTLPQERENCFRRSQFYQHHLCIQC